VPLERLVGEDAAQVRMPFEVEAEHVIGLALEQSSAFHRLIIEGSTTSDSRSGTLRRRRDFRCIE